MNTEQAIHIERINQHIIHKVQDAIIRNTTKPRYPMLVALWRIGAHLLGRG